MAVSATPRHCNMCGARLATDNTDVACRPCQRASRCPSIMELDFWQVDQMRDALAERHIGHVARAYRTHPFNCRGRISQELMARWLNISQTQLSRIENGRPVQDLGRLIQWARTLHIPRELLWFDLPGAGEDVKRREFLITGSGAIAAGVLPAVPNPGEWNGVAARQDQREDRASNLPSALAPSALSVAPWATPIYDATLDPARAARNASSDSEPGRHSYNLRQLRDAADMVMRAHLASDYMRLARSLPMLIGHAELASLQAGENDYINIQRVLSDIYAVVGWTLIKADSPAAAWIAAQRAVRIAGNVDDAIRSAAATRCLSEVHMRARNFEEASRLAFLATVYLDLALPAEKSAAACMRGAALLSASAAAARRGDGPEAYTALKAASVCATQLGEDRAEVGTVFGPTNVAIHQVAVAVELGNTREAMNHIPAVNLGRMPAGLTERRARFLIDVARSHGQAHDDSSAIGALINAEDIAPDEIRNHRLTHDLLRGLLLRERRTSGLRALADRCKVLN
jgi:transcriptional regulator with XRE-family HTH domain